MAHSIKYNSSSTETLCEKKGNWWATSSDVVKGPTSSTGFWSGITPPAGGYTIYQNKAANGPSIRTAANDAELITVTAQITGTVYATAADCLSYYAGQIDLLVVNIRPPFASKICLGRTPLPLANSLKSATNRYA